MPKVNLSYVKPKDVNRKEKEVVIFKAQFVNQMQHLIINRKMDMLMEWIKDWIDENIDKLFSKYKQSSGANAQSLHPLLNSIKIKSYKTDDDTYIKHQFAL